MSIKIKMDEKGRILIPQEIRNQLQFEPGERFSFKIVDGNLVILKSSTLDEFLNEIQIFQSQLKKNTKTPISTDKLF
jgi:AbrB family looped-hinge helix DNA binding protein